MPGNERLLDKGKSYGIHHLVMDNVGWHSEIKIFP